jgi:hypothetical protein
MELIQHLSELLVVALLLALLGLIILPLEIEIEDSPDSSDLRR